MARIVELVLILNGLGGIAGYLGFKVRRAKQASKAGINKAAGKIGVEVYHEDDTPDHFEGNLAANVAGGYIPDPEPPKKRSRLARFGDTIR